MADARLNNINIDLNRVPSERCECGNGTWTIDYILKHISALVSPTGKETLAPIQIFACAKCHKFHPSFKNLNDTEEIPTSEGESLGGSIANSSAPEEPQKNTSKLFVG